MATKDEIKSLLEAEIGPLKAKLTSIEKSFFELEKSVKHFSAKYDELLKQVQRSNDRTASLSTDVKNLKEDIKQCKKIGREIEDLSQYLRRDCLKLTGVLPAEEVSCFDLVCSIGKEMGIELQDEDISTAHRLPTYNKSAEDKIIVKFTRRSIRDEFYGKRKTIAGKEVGKVGTLRGLSQDPKKKLYISESLTQARKKLFGSINKLSALCSLPPCLDQIQTVHYHYLIYWIYLLLQISINYSFLTSLISGILKNYQISLISIFAMQVKSIHIIRDMLQKVTSTNHVPGPI